MEQISITFHGSKAARRCARCAGLSATQAFMVRSRRLAQGRVVVQVPELYEVKKVAEYAKAKEARAIRL